jgi:hypothetical protein
MITDTEEQKNEHVDAMLAALKAARKDADVFGSGFLAVSADGSLRRLNPIGVKIDEVEAMKP